MTKVRNDMLRLQNALGYSVNTTGLVKQSIALSTQLDFLQPYATYADDLLVLNYPNYLIKKNVLVDTVKLYVCNALLSEKYNLQTLINTLNLEYNPIENYNMVEDGTDKRTLDYAQRQSNSQFESAQKTSTDNTTHGVTAYNTTSSTNTEQDNRTITNNPYTDKSEQTELAHTDTNNNTHHLTRTGNIGVTTSQQMIESERALANINISAKIVEIVVKNICKGVQGAI